MKLALVQNGVVINVCIWDGVSNFPTPGIDKIAIEESSPVSRGFTYTDGAFTPYEGWNSQEPAPEEALTEEAPPQGWLARIFG